VNFAGRRYAKNAKPASDYGFVEPVSQFFHQLDSGIKDKPLILFADVIFESLFAGQDDRGHQHVIEGWS